WVHSGSRTILGTVWTLFALQTRRFATCVEDIRKSAVRLRGKGSEVLALIPARGGSKGIPRKNIKVVAGKPLIAYSIEQALASRLITRTIVSTDDPEIAQVAREFGAKVPFMRPGEFAQDLSPDIDVFRHALKWL